MKECVIKASGNIKDVARQLKEIQKIMGKGVTLARVAEIMKNNKGW